MHADEVRENSITEGMVYDPVSGLSAGRGGADDVRPPVRAPQNCLLER